MDTCAFILWNSDVDHSNKIITNRYGLRYPGELGRISKVVLKGYLTISSTELIYSLMKYRITVLAPAMRDVPAGSSAAV
jgi:hypothetical protein